MKPDRYLELLRRDGDLLVASAERDLAAPVPSCPGWSVRDVVEHTAGVYQHKLACMRLGRRPDPWPPEDLAGREPLGFFRESLDEVSGEEPAEIVGRLWDDDKLRKQVEAAASAAQEGTKRVRGQKVKQGGGRRGLLFLILAAALGFLFLNPKTGPSARNFAKQAYGAITSGD